MPPPSGANRCTITLWAVRLARATWWLATLPALPADQLGPQLIQLLFGWALSALTDIITTRPGRTGSQWPGTSSARTAADEDAVRGWRQVRWGHMNAATKAMPAGTSWPSAPCHRRGVVRRKMTPEATMKEHT